MACSGGLCIGTPKVCTASGPCNVSTCNSATGNCDNSLAPVGTACTVDGSCLQNATCDANGKCNGDSVPDGTPCDDSSCTSASACVSGACTCIEAPDFGGGLAPIIPGDVDMSTTAPAHHSKGCTVAAGDPPARAPGALFVLVLVLAILARRRLIDRLRRLKPRWIGLPVLAFLPAMAQGSPVAAANSLCDAALREAWCRSREPLLLAGQHSPRACDDLRRRGAETTAAEMRTTLALPDRKAAYEGFAQQRMRWDALTHRSDHAEPAFTLSVVNRVWAQQGKPLRAEFDALMQDAYHAPITRLDFVHAAEPSRLEINRWVSERTKAKIPELLPPGIITEGTRLVLTNAIYLKAPWSHPFEKRDTKPTVFHLANGKQASVPFMNQIESFSSSGNFPGGQIHRATVRRRRARHERAATDR